MTLKLSRLATQLVAAVSMGLLAGCSVKDFAIKEIASSLSEGSGSAFAQEPDIEFAGQAIPFSLKLVESLLSAQPDNPDLLVAASSGFTQYAKGWVEQPADFIELDDFFAAQAEYERAVGFYLRGYDYGMSALEARYPGISQELVADPAAGAARLGLEDVEAAYWTAAGLGSAISLSRTDPEMLAQLSIVEALAERALALDPDWSWGATHELLITLKASSFGDWEATKREILGHYDEAVRISGGASASAHVNLAEAISVQDQNRVQFEDLLNRALAINADDHIDNRLAILIAQQRAEWLLEQVDDLFLE